MPATTPDWAPFAVLPPGERTSAPRGVTSPEGIGDRLRAAAFAELQAREAFDWAIVRFPDAPPRLKAAWKSLSEAEQRHLGWLLTRMEELGVEVTGRPVSDGLWRSLMGCESAEQFCRWIADAEERGRRAGVRISARLAEVDPTTAEIFHTIAEEEVAHIAIAQRFFGPAS